MVFRFHGDLRDTVKTLGGQGRWSRTVAAPPHLTHKPFPLVSHCLQTVVRDSHRESFFSHRHAATVVPREKFHAFDGVEEEKHRGPGLGLQRGQEVADSVAGVHRAAEVAGALTEREPEEGALKPAVRFKAPPRDAEQAVHAV